MQSRRREDYAGESPSAKLRSHRHQLGHDSYPNSRHDFPDRSHRRSLSPHGQGGLRRDFDGDGRSTSVERRDYGWQLGGRTEQVQSRSPPHGHTQKRPHLDEEIVRRKREYPGPMEFEAGSKARVKRDYEYENDLSTRSILKGQEHHDSRIPGTHGHRNLFRKQVPMEEGNETISYSLHSDVGPTSIGRETGRHLPPNSWSRDAGRFEIESTQYRDTGNLDRLLVIDMHKDGGKPSLPQRDISYNVVPKSYSKDFAGSSSGILQREHLGAYQDGIPRVADEYLRSGAEPTDTLCAYSQSQLIDTAKNFETKRKTMTSYQGGAYSPARAECKDHRYLEPQLIVNEDHVYPPADVYSMLPSASRSDYGHNQVDYDHRDCLKRGLMYPIIECGRSENADEYFVEPRKSNIMDYSSEKPSTLDYSELRNPYNTSIQHEDYMDSGCTDAEFGRRVSRNHELTHISTSQARQVSELRSNHHFQRCTDRRIEKERPLDMSHIARYEPDMHRLAARSERMEEELALYDSLHNMPKTGYSLGGEITGYDSRSNPSTKQNEPRHFDNPYDDEWNDDDINDLYSHRTGMYGYNNDHRKAEMSYDRKHYREDRTHDELSSSHGSMEYSRLHPARFYNRGRKYIKHYPKSRSSTWYNSSQYNRKSGSYKQKNVLKRKEYHHVDEVYDGEVLEDWNSSQRYDLSEESDEFKQLVHEAFLTYCKMLNANPSVQRRYMEQGKAGTLFCIVCGRSYSKEFMDTQRLAKHALMSNKPGLRAEHLGLHKAICVLMGWDSNPPPDVLTWAPQKLSSTEALAQKEDLILWPPFVIMHNISALKKNQDQRDVMTPEMLEAFLRGKGFVDGKIKVCQGKNADKSLMVVKFLGTFTGLENAEKIHRYFAVNKRGRTDFETTVKRNDRPCSSSGAELQKYQEEPYLYGYMGISEDLDKLDFHAKRSVVIKSKTEILDVANAPVKAEER